MKKRGRPRKDRSKAVLKGNYKGYDFVIVDRWMEIMRHYNAYIRIPEDHKAFKIVSKQKWFNLYLSGKRFAKSTKNSKNKFPMPDKRLNKRRYHLDYDALNDFVNVHGGFTFAHQIKKSEINEFLQAFTPGLWVGWDYAHAGDEIYIEKIEDVLPEHKESWKSIIKIHTIKERRWRVEEVEKHVKLAIEDLMAMADWRLRFERMIKNVFIYCFTYIKKIL